MASRHSVVLIVPARGVDNAPVQLATPGLWSSGTDAAQYAGYVAMVLNLPFIPDAVIAAGFVVESAGPAVSLAKQQEDLIHG